MDETRLEKGLRILSQVDGEAGVNVIEAFKDICPELGRYTVEFPFGDIYSREELNFRDREIATIAALTALGNCTPQLKVHVSAGLNVGLTKIEIQEIIIQMAIYAGFPAALNAMIAADEVFKK